MIRTAVQGLLMLSLGMLAAVPAATAQQPAKVPRVGILWIADPSLVSAFHEAFRQGLRDLGYAEGKAILIEARYAEGRYDRLAGLAAALVQLPVDVFVAPSTAAVRAARQATTSIPIVMVNVYDPVALGFVATLARPGGNITGLSNLAEEYTAKTLELLKAAVPRISRVAVFLTPANPATQRYKKEIEAAAAALGLKYDILEVRDDPGQLEETFAAVTRAQSGALLLGRGGGEALSTLHRKRILDFAKRNRLPTMWPTREAVETGGLMAYGPSVPDMLRRAATYVDKILKGAKPADLPVEQPTRFELVINVKTAKALGLTIPQSVLIRADQVIQ